MSAPVPVSVTFYPRYQSGRYHLVPIVVGATRRVLLDNGTVTMETISAAQYHEAVSDEVDELCAALDTAQAREAR